MSQQEFLETVMKEREYLDMKAAAAFVRAQAGFGAALKTSTNPHFRSRYADLSACVEAVIDSLHKNGFALMQKTHECESGVAVETILMHESGEQISGGILRVPASKQDPQGYGSALTYARRYSLMAACGIAPEDDDGNAASRPQPVKVSLLADNIVQEVRDAAINGIDSLTAAYNKNKNVAGFKEFWLKEGAALKQLANGE